jgi:cytoplasmic iron level regulating protein YaaA (DUF328/UPF0246 family)
MANPEHQHRETEPVFMGHTSLLLDVMRKQSPQNLRDLMGISENLANLNFERFQVFDGAAMPESGSPAALTFAGDTYVGFDASSLSAEDMTFAQAHIGILSGLYGILRPLDRIQPYRLEMGTRIETSRGTNLYRFWGDHLSERINALTEKHAHRALVNLASNEYFSAVDAKALTLPVITPVFKEVRDGKAKVISFLAKKARGSMARYIVQGRIEKPEALKDFREGGYRYEGSLSNAEEFVFLRES